MEGAAHAFIEAGIKYDIDPLIMIAIGKHESGLGKYYSDATNNQRHSYAGVMTWDKFGNRSLKAYPSWEDSVFDHARILREVYINRGKDTIKDVWLTYAPLSENMNSSWGAAVSRHYTAMKSHFSN